MFFFFFLICCTSHQERETAQSSSWSESVFVHQKRKRGSQGCLLNRVSRQPARGPSPRILRVVLLRLCSVALHLLLLCDSVFFGISFSVAVLLGHLIRLCLALCGLANKGKHTIESTNTERRTKVETSGNMRLPSEPEE